MELKAEGVGYKIYEDAANGRLVVELDHKRPGILSKTGKSKLVVSTGGFVPVGEGLKLGLNLIRQ